MKSPLKITAFIIFYISGLIFTVAYSLIQIEQHPIITPKDIDRDYFRFFVAWIIVCLVLVVVYLLYLFLMTCGRNLLAYRHNAFVNLSIFLLAAVVVMLALGGLDLFVYSSSIVMFIFTLTNFYSFLLQYLYSPTQEQLKEF